MTTFSDLKAAMENCFQTSGVSMVRHGEMVKEKFAELLRIYQGETISGWRVPDWVLKYGSRLAALVDQGPSWEEYTYWHDVGKPFCRTVDVNGKQHFPGHDEVSREKYLEAGGDPAVAELIGYDMILHLVKADEVEVWLERWGSAKTAILLTAALAEVHANAEMFGGVESTSFKIKYKHLEKRGKQICGLLFVNVKEGQSCSLSF